MPTPPDHYLAAAINENLCSQWADWLGVDNGTPGALSGGIAYFRAHRTDAEHNRQNARIKLPMPVLTIGGTASFGADLEGEIRPLAEKLRAVMIDASGHYLAEEQPECLLHELLTFLHEMPEGQAA